MRDFVYGDDVIVKAYKVDNYYPFACVEEMALTMKSALLPSSVPDSGAWEDFKYSGKNGWDVTLSGVLVLQDEVDTLWFGWEMLLLALRTTGLDLYFEWKDRNGVLKYAAGHALIPESGTIARSNDFGRWNLRLQGTGPLDVNGVITPPIQSDVERINWIVSGAEPNKVQNNNLIGRTKEQILHVSREGDDKYIVIDAGNPTAKQVRLDNVEGSLRFAIDFEVNEQVWALIKTN